MNVYIIYNAVSEQSSQIAEESLNSFAGYESWVPSLFNGCDPSTLHVYEERYNLPEDPKKKFVGLPMYPHKKSCFYSHYALWEKCVKMGDAIAIVEHDTVCVGEVPNYAEDGITQLTTDSMLGRNAPFLEGKYISTMRGLGNGLHRIWYKHPHGHIGLAGCTGYIITPTAAEYYFEKCKTYGWHQNDLLIRDEHTPLYYFYPSPIKWCKEKELRSSTQGVKL